MSRHDAPTEPISLPDPMRLRLIVQALKTCGQELSHANINKQFRIETRRYATLDDIDKAIAKESK